MTLDRTNASIVSGEYQSKFMQDRVTSVEKYFGDLCAEFAAYTRKTAKIRDKGDAISQLMYDYAQNVSHNPSSKKSLLQFSQNLSAVQDYRNAQVDRLEAKVVEPLKLYGTVLKQARNDLKNAFTARDREAKQQQQVDKAKNSRDRSKQSKAETELQKAHVDASRAGKALEEEMDKFEKKKVQDLKTNLSDFVTIEMMFHAKALELYTLCYQSLSELNEEEDLEEFRNSLRPESSASRLQLQKYGSRQSLNSTAQSISTPVVTQPQPAKQSLNTNRSAMMDDDDSEEDDEEDEEDEDEEEEESEEEPVPRRR